IPESPKKSEKLSGLIKPVSLYVGVDVAKNSLDVAISNSEEIRQFTNDHEGITHAVQYIAGLKPSGVILEATGHLEMPLTAVLQADRLPVAIINPRQVSDFALPSRINLHRLALDLALFFRLVF
ncbi:transposase, partial [Chloroflexota bacterium]